MGGARLYCPVSVVYLVALEYRIPAADAGADSGGEGGVLREFQELDDWCSEAGRLYRPASMRK